MSKVANMALPPIEATYKNPENVVGWLQAKAVYGGTSWNSQGTRIYTPVQVPHLVEVSTTGAALTKIRQLQPDGTWTDWPLADGRGSIVVPAGRELGFLFVAGVETATVKITPLL